VKATTMLLISLAFLNLKY